MPQLDKISFFAQFIYLVIFFFGLYILSLRLFFPSLIRIFIFRREIQRVFAQTTLYNFGYKAIVKAFPMGITTKFSTENLCFSHLTKKYKKVHNLILNLKSFTRTNFEYQITNLKNFSVSRIFFNNDTIFLRLGFVLNKNLILVKWLKKASLIKKIRRKRVVKKSRSKKIFKKSNIRLVYLKVIKIFLNINKLFYNVIFYLYQIFQNYNTLTFGFNRNFSQFNISLKKFIK